MSDRFLLPFNAMRLVSRQGWRPKIGGQVVSSDVASARPGDVEWKWHNGTDWIADQGETEGTPLRAGLSARVLFADNRGGVSPFGGYGNAIVLEYAPRVLSLFAHCQAVYPAPGDVVAAGDVVARVGRTSHPGRFVGMAHLHWEIVTRWPLLSDDHANRYDVLDSLATAGYQLIGSGLRYVQPGAVTTPTPGGTTTRRPGAPPPAPSSGIVNLALLVVLARALRRRA